MQMLVILPEHTISLLLSLVAERKLADGGSMDSLTGLILRSSPNFLMCDLTLNLFYRIRATSWIIAEGLRGIFGWRQSTGSVLGCVAWLLACWGTIRCNSCRLGPRGGTQEKGWNRVRLGFVLLALRCEELNMLLWVIWSFFSPNLCF